MNEKGRKQSEKKSKGTVEIRRIKLRENKMR
jgi:hypothetical protein